MKDLPKHIAALSPEKRKLLEALLQKEEQIDITQSLIVPLKRDTNRFSLSFAQERLWLLDQLDPGNPFYNIPLAIQLTGQVDVAALERSINAIVARHETLRTSFAAVDGQTVQTIAPALTVALPLIDLQSVPADEREAETQRVAREEAARRFDLRHAPLLRTTLVRRAAQDHVLLATFHHIIADGWSTSIFMRELGAFYDAFSSARSAAVPDLQIQYVDFAAWQKQWLKDSRIQQQLAYWQRQLANVPELALPTDRPAQAQSFTFRGARQALAVPQSLAAALKALSQREATTLFVVLLAAFELVLARYSGQDDIAVGTPIAGRRRDELEPLIGFFNNMLVLRTRLNSSPTIRELLQRTHQTALDAFERQDVPFEKLVESIEPEGRLSRSPLFQVVFIVQNVPAPQIDLPQLRIRQLETHSGTARYDLLLSLKDTPQGLTGRLHYNADLFDATTIERLIEHYLLTLEQLAADPAQRSADLALLTTAERQRLDDLNATSVDLPDACVHSLIEAHAARTPDAIAAVFEQGSLSYSDLNRRSGQLARHLQAQGVTKETRVGLCLDRSPELLVGLLAILKAGGACVLLDPAFPPQRIVALLDDSQARIALTHQRWAAQLGAFNGQLIALDEWSAPEVQPQELPPVSIQPTQIAAVCYVSAPGGRPAGVLLDQRNLANTLHALIRQAGITERDSLLALAPLAFEHAILDLLLPLVAGARLVLLRNDGALDGRQLAALVASSKCTLLQATPALLRLLLESGWTGDRSLKIVSSGEILDRPLADQLSQHAGEIWQCYGHAETAGWSLVSRVVPGDQPVTLQQPLANTQVYVLNSRRQPVPTGVVGELYIGGAGLARGYLDRPELTAEKFIVNPFSKEPGARLYKTGDLARFHPDGTIELRGRTDRQVTLRGMRIERGEIEAALLEHEAVREAVVLLRDELLMAYVTEEPRTKNQEPSAEASSSSVGAGKGDDRRPGGEGLRAFLQERLPAAMIPATFVVVESLPRTAGGQIDREALAGLDRHERAGAWVAPRTAVEEAVAGMWEAVLGVERVGVNDNFFDLGGHSLKAALLFSRIREAFQVQLPLRSLFEATTVASLAGLIIANEARPGQTEKIAQMLKRIKGSSPDDLRKLLEQKRRERNNG